METNQALTDMILDTVTRVDNNRRGAIVTDIAILTLLIDTGLITTEAACKRIDHIQSVLPPNYQSDEVSLRTSFITEWLRRQQPSTGWTPTIIPGGKD